MNYVNINNIKSAEAICSAWSNIFESTCLDTTGEVFDKKPTGFVQTFLTLTSQSAATAFYEQQMYLNEVNPSTAILKKSLISGLSNTEIAGIYAKPSSARFAFCMKKNQIVNAIDSLSSSFLPTDTYLILNKDTIFNIDGYPSFTLKRNVKIMYKTIRYTDNEGIRRERTNVYALYDDNDIVGKTVNSMNSYTVETREITYKGEVFVLLYLDCLQETRTYTEFTVVNSSSPDFKVNYTDNLCGFEIYVEESKGQWVEIKAYPEGSTLTGDHDCFYSIKSVDNETSSINITFNKNVYGYKPSATQKIKFVVWTTYGSSGNIEFPNLSDGGLNNLYCNLNQDVTDKRQSVINNIEVLIMVKDTKSSGGRDELSFTDLKRYVISKKRANDTITTEKQLSDKCYENDFDVKKIRHDVINQNYRAYRVFKDGNDNTIASTMTPFRFNYEIDNQSYPFNNISHTMVTPKNIFVDQGDFYFYDKDNKMTVSEYIKEKANEDNDKDVSFKHQTFFPFIAHIDAGKYVQVNVIDPNIDSTNIPISCEMVNDNAQDSISISNFTIYRNYCGEKEQYEPLWNNTAGDNFYYDKQFFGGYRVFFVCTFGNAQMGTITNGQFENVMFKVKISSETNSQYFISKNCYAEPVAKGDRYKFIVSFDLFVDDTTIDYSKNRFYIENNKYVNHELGTIESGTKGWVPYPVSSNDIPNTRYMDFDLSFEIGAFFKCSNTEYNDLKIDDPNNLYLNTYDGNWLSSEERGALGTERYYCVTSYKSDKMRIMRDLTDDVYMNVKIDTKETYYTYVGDDGESIDLFDCKEDSEGKFVYGADTEENFNKYFSVVDGKPKYIDNTWEDYVSIGGNSFKKEVPLTTNYECTLYDVLAIDRIYTTKMNYSNLISSFYGYLDDIDSVRNYLIDGFQLFCGVKKTEGVSQKFKIRRVSDNYESNLNSLSVSFEFDIKMENLIEYDEDYVKETLIETLVEYINGFDKEYLSFDSIYDLMKTSVPNIAYINAKKMNGYDVGEYQTIINDKTNVQEAMSVRMIPAEDATDDNLDTIEFVPAIIINFIN